MRARVLLILERVASSIPLGIVKDSVHYLIMESSRADTVSLQVTPFQSHFFLYVRPSFLPFKFICVMSISTKVLNVVLLQVQEDVRY